MLNQYVVQCVIRHVYLFITVVDQQTIYYFFYFFKADVCVFCWCLGASSFKPVGRLLILIP